HQTVLRIRQICDHFPTKKTVMSKTVALLYSFIPLNSLASSGLAPDLESLFLVAIAAFTALFIYHREK
ncbi:MAG TPA: hypothetical protein PKY22_11635, partial [Accumulibacter sp.]|nr:hypothetical protein [Accumulibacter sp.]